MYMGMITMLKNAKAERLYQEIRVAYNDAEVKTDIELRTELLQCAQALVRDENYLAVATKVHGVASRANRRHLAAPIAAMVTLSNQTAKTSEYYWGVAATAILGGLMIH